MSKSAVAPRLSASADAGAAIQALDELLVERTEQAKRVAVLSGEVHKARLKLDEADSTQRRADGAGAFALAVAASEMARESLAAAARALPPAQVALRELDARIATAWRDVQQATRSAHLAAEAAAEADLRAAAAQTGHAARRLNEIRRALGSPLFPRIVVRDPCDPGQNAADSAPSTCDTGNVPFLENAARLRRDVETLRER